MNTKTMLLALLLTITLLVNLPHAKTSKSSPENIPEILAQIDTLKSSINELIQTPHIHIPPINALSEVDMAHNKLNHLLSKKKLSEVANSDSIKRDSRRMRHTEQVLSKRKLRNNQIPISRIPVTALNKEQQLHVSALDLMPFDNPKPQKNYSFQEQEQANHGLYHQSSKNCQAEWSDLCAFPNPESAQFFLDNCKEQKEFIINHVPVRCLNLAIACSKEFESCKSLLKNKKICDLGDTGLKKFLSEEMMNTMNQFGGGYQVLLPHPVRPVQVEQNYENELKIYQNCMNLLLTLRYAFDFDIFDTFMSDCTETEAYLSLSEPCREIIDHVQKFKDQSKFLLYPICFSDSPEENFKKIMTTHIGKTQINKKLAKESISGDNDLDIAFVVDSPTLKGRVDVKVDLQNRIAKNNCDQFFHDMMARPAPDPMVITIFFQVCQSSQFYLNLSENCRNNMVMFLTDSDYETLWLSCQKNVKPIKNIVPEIPMESSIITDSKCFKFYLPMMNDSNIDTVRHFYHGCLVHTQTFQDIIGHVCVSVIVNCVANGVGCELAVKENCKSNEEVRGVINYQSRFSGSSGKCMKNYKNIVQGELAQLPKNCSSFNEKCMNSQNYNCYPNALDLSIRMTPCKKYIQTNAHKSSKKNDIIDNSLYKYCGVAELYQDMVKSLEISNNCLHKFNTFYEFAERVYDPNVFEHETLDKLKQIANDMKDCIAKDPLFQSLFPKGGNLSKYINNCSANTTNCFKIYLESWPTKHLEYGAKLKGFYNFCEKIYEQMIERPNVNGDANQMAGVFLEECTSESQNQNQANAAKHLEPAFKNEGCIPALIECSASNLDYIPSTKDACNQVIDHCPSYATFREAVRTMHTLDPSELNLVREWKHGEDTCRFLLINVLYNFDFVEISLFIRLCQKSEEYIKLSQKYEICAEILNNTAVSDGEVFTSNLMEHCPNIKKILAQFPEFFLRSKKLAEHDQIMDCSKEYQELINKQKVKKGGPYSVINKYFFLK